MINAAEQYVDPAVSRAKFDRQLTEYQSLEADYRARGWFLVKAHWPVVIVVLASKKTIPPSIVTAVQFDYTNYDAEPPSVRLVDPFSGRCLPFNELPTRLPRMVSEQEVAIPGGAIMQLNQAQDLMQANSQEDIPFLCIPGVKEYHDHPGHSGDPWEIAPDCWRRSPSTPAGSDIKIWSRTSEGLPRQSSATSYLCCVGAS